MDPDECMATTSSTRFLQWIKLIDDEEWNEKTKADYLLTSIAYEIRKISVQLGGGKLPTFEEFLERFKRKDPDAPAPTDDLFAGISPGDYDDPTKLKGAIEPGVTPLDDKWKEVNRKAHQEWDAYLPEGCLVKE